MVLKLRTHTIQSSHLIKSKFPKRKRAKKLSKKEPHHQRNRQRAPRQLETQAFARGRAAGEGQGGVCAVDARAAVCEGVGGREGGDRVLGLERRDVSRVCVMVPFFLWFFLTKIVRNGKRGGEQRKRTIVRVEVRDARVVVVVVVESPEERDGAVEVGDEGDEAAKGDDDDKKTVEEGEGEGEGEIAEEREGKEEETEPSCFGRKGRRRRFSSCSCCCPLTEVSLVALGTGATLVLAGATEDDEVELGVGMLSETPTAPQTCWAKASVTGGKRKKGGVNRQQRMYGFRGFGRKRGVGGLTLLVCHGADVFNQAVQRGHELRVAADAGEVGDGAARGGYAGLCCG